jgi:hypothetical protein
VQIFLKNRELGVEIFAVDEESRSAFCYEMQEHANNDRRFLSAICFTDECTFTLNNEPNVQNTRYWAQENQELIFLLELSILKNLISGLGFLITILLVHLK